MASPIRERDLDGRIRIRIRDVNQLTTGSGLPSPACSIRSACLPDFGIALRMEYSNHRNALVCDPVEDQVREASNERHPCLAVEDWVGLWLADDSLKTGVDTPNQLRP